MQRLLVEPGEPVDDLMQLVLGAAFLLNLGDIVRVHGRERHLGEAFIVMDSGAHGFNDVGSDVLDRRMLTDYDFRNTCPPATRTPA